MRLGGPRYATVSLSSLDGTRQVAVSLNSDRILATQAQVDLGDALMTGFCGKTGSAGSSLPVLRALDAAVQPL